MESQKEYIKLVPGQQSDLPCANFILNLLSRFCDACCILFTESNNQYQIQKTVKFQIHMFWH